MGLLNRTENFIEHPIEGLLGLFGGRQLPSTPVYGNPNPPQAVGGLIPPQTLADMATQQAQNIPQNPSLDRYVTGFLDGQMPWDVKAGYQNAQRQAQMIRQAGLTPQQVLAYLANPKAFGEALSSRSAYHGINGGDVGVFGDPSAGGTVYTAPKYGVTNDGRSYMVGPDGLTSLGELDPSYSEQTARLKAEADNAGYTLGPGGKRYDRNNNVVAEAPFAPQYREVGPDRTLVEVGGGAGPGGRAPTVADMLGYLPPGSHVTSTGRTPAHNAAVGGVADSHHLNNTAIDFVPPPGVTIGQVKQQFAAAGKPLAEALDEGDHFHIAWGSPAAPGAGGARVVAQGAPRPQYRPATPEEKAAVGIPDNVPAQVSPDGKVEPISGGAAGLKQVPSKIASGYSSNVAQINQIDQAIKAIQANPHAIGLLRGVGEGINQRVDPNGIDARAKLANIGSLIIHDRSGAAVTASETPRLLPFVPTVTDSPQAAVKKLQALKQQLQNENDVMEITYGEDNGYRPMGGAQPKAGAPQAKAPPLKAPAPGTVQGGYRFKGGDPANPASWQKVG